MNGIASIFSGYGSRPAAGARTLPGEVSKPPLETQGIAGGGATDLDEMLVKLQQQSFYTQAALRVQTGDMPAQPLSRVDITDLALMIISGRSMSEALAAVAADRPPISAGPTAHRMV